MTPTGLAPMPKDEPRGSSVTALTWRTFVDQPQAGAYNMALDQALAECLDGDQAVLRFYGWVRPTISFGRNERAQGLYSLTRARELGVDFVRRPTGGRAVLHEREVTYSVVAPLRALGGPRDAYARINHAIAVGLEGLGASVELSRGGAVLPLDAGPCFQSPADGEVTVGGRKLVGSAQARVDGAMLQHGSIILSGDQALLEELTTRKVVSPRPATLRELVAGVGAEEVSFAVASAMRDALGGEWIDAGYRSLEMERARELQSARYAQQSWTWRR